MVDLVKITKNYPWFKLGTPDDYRFIIKVKDWKQLQDILDVLEGKIQDDLGTTYVDTEENAGTVNLVAINEFQIDTPLMDVNVETYDLTATTLFSINADNAIFTIADELTINSDSINATSANNIEITGVSLYLEGTTEVDITSPLVDINSPLVDINSTNIIDLDADLEIELTAPTIDVDTALLDVNSTEAINIAAGTNIGISSITGNITLEVDTGFLTLTGVAGPHIDEVAATAAGLTTGQVYYTPDGVLAIKL